MKYTALRRNLVFDRKWFKCGIWSVVLYIVGAKMSGFVMVPLMTVFFVIIGLLMFIFGLMSEIMIKTYYYGVQVDL